jgi:uncharacterized membrane protein
MKNRLVGHLIISIAGVILIIVASFNQALTSIVSESCSHGIQCPMYTTLTIQKIVSYALTFIVGLTGVVILRMKDDTVKSVLPPLEGMEQTVVDILQKNQGEILQSKLPDMLDSNKVKVTRVLDALEQKGVIERVRRGMSNLVKLVSGK